MTNSISFPGYKAIFPIKSTAYKIPQALYWKL